MKYLFLLLFSPLFSQAQTYNLRRIIKDPLGNNPDSMYNKANSPDSFYRKVGNVYTFVFKEVNPSWGTDPRVLDFRNVDSTNARLTPMQVSTKAFIYRRTGSDSIFIATPTGNGDTTFSWRFNLNPITGKLDTSFLARFRADSAAKAVAIAAKQSSGSYATTTQLGAKQDTSTVYNRTQSDARYRSKRIETYSGTTNSSGIYTVTFSTAYSVAPSIQANIVGGTNTNLIKITSISTTAFTVTVVNRVDVLGLLPTYSNVNGASVDVLITEK